MAFAGVIMVLLAAGEVSLRVDQAVACVSAPRVAERLGAAGLSVVAAPSRRLAVSVTKRADHLLVRGVRTGARFERSVPLGDNACEAIERALVVLIVSWSRQLPAASAPQIARPPQPASPSTELPEVEPAAPEALTTSEALVPGNGSVDAPLDPAEAVVEASEPAKGGAPAGPTSPAASSEVSGRETSTASLPLVLDVGLLGGGAVGPTSTLVGQGQLQVGFGTRRLAALVEVGLQTTRTGVVGPTSVEASTQWASLSARVRFVPDSRVEFELALGGRLWRLAATSVNPAASTESFVPGGVVVNIMVIKFVYLRFIIVIVNIKILRYV